MPKSRRTWANYTFSWFSPSSQCRVTWRPASSNAARTWVGWFWLPMSWAILGTHDPWILRIAIAVLRAGLLSVFVILDATHWQEASLHDADCTDTASSAWMLCAVRRRQWTREHSVFSHHSCNVTFHRSSLMKMLQGSLRIVLVKVMRSLLLAWRRMLSSSFCFQQAFGRFLALVSLLNLRTGPATAGGRGDSRASVSRRTWMSLALAMFGVISSVFLWCFLCHLEHLEITTIAHSSLVWLYMAICASRNTS